MFSSQSRGLLAGLLLPLAAGGCSAPGKGTATAEFASQEAYSVSMPLEQAESQRLPELRYAPLIENASLSYDLGLLAPTVGRISLFLHRQSGHDFLIANIRSDQGASEDLSVIFLVERCDAADGCELQFHEGERTVRIPMGNGQHYSFKLESADGQVLDKLHLTLRDEHSATKHVYFEFPTKTEAIISEKHGVSVHVRWAAAMDLSAELEGRK